MLRENEKSLGRTFPICQHSNCSKNNVSNRIFWKKEIDNQYKFYLSTLRAERDAKYLLKEYSHLLNAIRSAESKNVQLRKDIRLLEMEMYVMCQRNAHDSVVIDGLQVAEYEAGEIKHLESQERCRMPMALALGDQENSLSRMLKEQINLLKRKDGEDAELIGSLKVEQQDVDAETSSRESSQETDSFYVSAHEDIQQDEGLGSFVQMKETYGEYVAKKEILDLKNTVNINIIYDCLQQFTEGMRVLEEEYLSVFKISTEVEFIREYMERLDAMRKRKEIVRPKTAMSVQRIDQLSIIYDTLMCEKWFLVTALHYFTSTLKDDFEAHCVILRKTEELFAKHVVDSDGQEELRTGNL